MGLNRRILIIHDDPCIRGIYEQILCSKYLNTVSSQDASDKSDEFIANRSFELTFVNCGEEAIELMRDSVRMGKTYVAAFVDLELPGLNWAETTAWIWMIDPKIKILIVTAFSQYLSEDFTMVAGRDDLFYLRKPFKPEEIRQFARAFSKQWRLEREMEMLTEDLKIAHEKLEDINNNLQKKVEEQTTMLIQSDKMASIGLLAAGVAHEINNPTAFLNNNLISLRSYINHIRTLFKKYHELEKYIEKGKKDKSLQIIKEVRDFWIENKIDFIMGDIDELIGDSLEGTQRISRIVSDLKNFARAKEDDIELVNLNEVIDTTLNLIWNELKYKTKIIKDYGELPKIRCLVQKISQVFINILTNASQAIKEKGTITIVTRHIKQSRKEKNEYIEVRLSDDGIGIPKENMTKIFDPFFTTKQENEGTGLGLKITYDIIKAHGGKVKVESEEGKGTTFIIRMPLNTKV